MKNKVNKQYFRLRCFPDSNDYYSEFLNEEYVAIGWPDIESVQELNKSDISNKLASEYPLLKGRALGLTTGFFVRFKAIHEGDIILLPYQNEISIVEATSSYYFDTKGIDTSTAHRVKIKFLKSINKSELTAKLKGSINTITTIISLNNYAEEINSLLTSEQLTINKNKLDFFTSINTNKQIYLSISNNVNKQDLINFLEKMNL